MRNTTCISVALSLVATVAVADPMPAGCFVRDYDAAHLTAHPGQNVAGLRLDFHHDAEFGQPVVDVTVRLANQGRAAAEGMGGRVLTQIGLCWEDGGRAICGVECDGGTFEARGTRDAIEIVTRNFWVGEIDDCGGAFDLAETASAPTTYRLTRADPAACED